MSAWIPSCVRGGRVIVGEGCYARIMTFEQARVDHAGVGWKEMDAKR